MDHQPRYNRILGYEPESNRAVFELAPGQYGSVGVINCAKTSAQDPGLPEYTKIKHSQWQTGRSIRINELGDRGMPVTDADSRGVYHRNCMWFDVEIDKQYLDENAITHVDTILRGNISDNMIHSSIWWPVNSGPPDFTGSNTVVGPNQPENPVYGDVWVETETAPGDPLDGEQQMDVPVRIWTYTKLVGYTGNIGEPNYEPIYDWEIVYGNENSQGLYNTTTINDIPTYVFNSEKQCRFVVQVHWNQNFAHTAIDREVALYVFKGDTDATRALDDYIVKSPIVRMRNQVNPGMPEFDQPTQKGFKPAELLEYYFDPRFKNLSIPITDTEIVMDIMSGTATIDPNDEYENAVFIDVIGEGAELTLNYGAGSEAWVMAPINDGVVTGNFPYYIGTLPPEFVPDGSGGGSYQYLPTTEAGSLTLQGAGRYAIYGPDAMLPQTAEISQWLDDNNFPPRDHKPVGVLTQHSDLGMLENTQNLTNITSWQDIMQSTGYRMFASVTGDFNLPAYQSMTDLTSTFEGATDFTDIADALPTLITNTTSMLKTFAGCANYSKNPSFNTSNVTNMRETFDGCSNFNANINDWDTSSVTDMFGMFRGCANFNEPLGAWDTSAVRNMGDMFAGCSVYDQFIATWDVEFIPQKPTGFDTGTTTEWTDFEKPWWGASVRPETFEYVMFDVIKSGFGIQAQGDNSRLQIFGENQRLLGISETYSEQVINFVGKVYVFGYADGVRIWNNNIKKAFNNNRVRYEHRLWKRINEGYYNDLDYDVVESWSTDSITLDDIQADVEHHTVFIGDANNIRSLSTDQILSDNNNFELWHQIFGSIGNKGLRWLGRIPTDIRSDLIFGFADHPNPEEYLMGMFAGTSNMPGPLTTAGWQYNNTDQVADLTRTFAYMTPDANTISVIQDIIQAHARVNANYIWEGSDLSGFSLPMAYATKITDLTGAYHATILDNTAGTIQLTDCDLSECMSYDYMFINNHSTNTFVDQIQLPTTTGTTFKYTFAYADVRPLDCSTVSANWDMSQTQSITGMFLGGVFPDSINDWDLSNYDSDITTDQGYLSMPCQNHDHVFTGCSGTPTSMSNWKLPPARGMVIDHDTNYNSVPNVRGEWFVNTSVRTTDTIVYQDVMLPWWFAGCTEFDCDISDWQTTQVTSPGGYENIGGLTMSVRLGTFAHAKEFNSAIPWFYPEQDYYSLEFVRNFTELYYANIANSIRIRFAEHINPKLYKMDSIEYGKSAQKHIWWHTFVGASAYNNGGATLPVVMANDMVDTFRASGINQAVNIRKPVWGKAYYQGVFRETQAWTGSPELNFECQNRSDTPELENVYYHSIYATDWFKDSNFGGTLGPGFKWFFFNVTNIAGSTYMKTGNDRELTGWGSYANRDPGNPNVTPTVSEGIPRSIVGNITDTQADIEQDRGEEGLRCITNGSMYDLLYPPIQRRRLIQYCIGRPWFKAEVANGGYDNYDTGWYGLTAGYPTDPRDLKRRPTMRPRTPAEITNLSGMFANATNFDQDLSAWWSRWTPVSGAYTYGEFDAWDYDPHFNSGFKKYRGSYNNRYDASQVISNTTQGRFTLTSNNTTMLPGGAPNTYHSHYVTEIPGLPDWQPQNTNDMLWKINDFEYAYMVNYYDDPWPISNGGYDYGQGDVFETFAIVFGSDMLFTGTGIEGDEITLTAKEGRGRIFSSTTSNKWLLMQGTSSVIKWIIIDDPSVPPTDLLPGETLTAIRGPNITDSQGGSQQWRYAWQPYAYTPGDTFDPIYGEQVLLENGHRYNQYGDSQGDIADERSPDYSTPTNASPDKIETDLVYLDNQANDLDRMDLPPDQAIELWHATQTHPNDFATGATNFTPDKWPLWMTGIQEAGMSTPDIQTYLDPETSRTPGGSRNITCYPWTTEPFGWPHASWYQDGTY